MVHGQSSVCAGASLVELREAYTEMSPAEQASPLYSHSIEELNTLSDDRHERLSADTGSCPLVIMVLL